VLNNLALSKKRKISSGIFLFLFSFANLGIAASSSVSDKQLHEIGYTYPTKFGDLKFIQEDGSLGGPAQKLTLAGVDFLNASTKPDGYDYSQSLMSADDLYGNSLQVVKKTKPSMGRPQTERMIILEGPDGNCTRQLIILDFTGSKPFISERFGYNPDGKACLKFIRAKWGKKESYIYLEGPMKYVYYTGGRVIGPID
jgi:hypothetical protein